jgi:GT2 family glycosyltransferase
MLAKHPPESMMGRVKVSVVVPVWNGRKYLGPCLDAVLEQDMAGSEIIVVDDGSTDGSADFVAEYYPQVQLVRKEHNEGYAAACNLGMERAQGDVLVLLNQDTRVEEGWLRALAAAVEDESVGVAGCKILYPDGRLIQHAGGWIDWPLGLARHYGKGEPDEGQWDEPRRVEYVTGASFAFRRDVMDTVGRLDEGFRPGYYEDADYCLRVRAAGRDIVHEPRAALVHAESTSLSDRRAISSAYQRGRLRLVLKHVPPERLLAEFVPAEERYQPAAIRGGESASLRVAYLDAMQMVVPVLRQQWNVGGAVARRVVKALRHLYHLAWEEDWRKVEESAAAVGEPLPSRGAEQAAAAVPLFHEFEFRSNTPVVGPVLARLRSLWYSVAARWAVRYLAQQQDVYTRSLERRLMELVQENALLAEGIANLLIRLEAIEERDG